MYRLLISSHIHPYMNHIYQRCWKGWKCIENSEHFFRNTANSPVFYLPVCLTAPVWKHMSNTTWNISSLWSFFDLRKNRYIYLEGEIHMLSWLSYPSSPILAPVMGDKYVINWWECDGQFKMVDYISVKLAKKQDFLNLIVALLEYRSLFSHYHPLFSHILANISTMKYTYIFNIFLEYNHILPTHLKDTFFGQSLSAHSHLFNYISYHRQSHTVGL